MKNKLKKFLLKMHIFKYAKYVKSIYHKYIIVNKSKKEFIKYCSEIRIYDIDKKYEKLNKMLTEINYNQKFSKKGLIYYIDEKKVIYSNNFIYENFTVDYSKILNKSLNDFKCKENDDFSVQQNNLINALNTNLNNCISAAHSCGNSKAEKYLKNISDKRVSSFEEALQRILWYNQIMWQTGHRLVGLGRLDKILDDFYSNDIKNKIITKEEAYNLIKEFILLLHNNFWYKSSALMGDTGQIIILGGLEENNEYFCNDLTYLFIDVIKALQIPEPKSFLRVSSKMPDSLMSSALESIKTGVGCPLLSNDDIVISKLIEAGIKKTDAYNYVTSACWEPLIPSKSVAQNNVATITLMKPFNEMFTNENLSNIKSIDDIFDIYNGYLKKYIDNIVDSYEKQIYMNDSYVSLFVDKCQLCKKDITKSGAEYNNIGFTSVSIANVVNSLININEFVFVKKEYTLEQMELNRRKNFSIDEEMRYKLKNNNTKYGMNKEKPIEFTNKLISMVKNILGERKTKFGGNYKFGLSAPSYIRESVDCSASFDGRKNFEPFYVHISCENSDYINLVEFASRINYSGCINGNVVDFITSPNLLDKNMDKFKTFMFAAIKEGYYQMQMNVISSDILLKAKENPELFPNLIVRVWGFSAYFKDLPEEYKNLIIERTLKSEGKVA